LCQKLQKLVWEIGTAILPAVLFALFIRVEVAKAVEIEVGPSMQPNMYQGYRLMTEKVSYHFRLPQRGDVVVVNRPGVEVSLVKRVLGLPGEIVEVQAGHVLIGPAQIPDGYIFIIGDNRPISRDSRAIGPVELTMVEGRVWLVYWPLEKFELVP